MENPHPTDTPIRTEEEQAKFFCDVLDRCHEAEKAVGVETHRLRLAGTTIELRFAGERLIPHFMPALSHLVIETPGDVETRADETGAVETRADETGAVPDLVLHLWDSASTGVENVKPPCTWDAFTDRGDIWGMSSPRYKSAFHWIEFSVQLLDLESGEGIYWINADEALPYWAKASPIRTLLHWWMEHNGAQLLHAAGVGTEDGALLITGKGGVGKSTTALSCLNAGMRYIADDYLVVQLDPEPMVHSLYCTAKLNPDQVEKFPRLAPHVTHEGLENDEKAVIQLVPDFAEQVTLSMPLVGIATPRFGGVEETTFGPVDVHGLERAAAFTTMSQLPHAGPSTHEFIRRMVDEVPRVTINLGTNLEALPVAIGDLVAKDAEEIRGIGWPAEGDEAAEAPLVSVVIPVYNGADFLPAAVGNILSQGYPSLEIIIVDDGSEDNIAEVVEALPVDVRFFPRDNHGPAAARNHGIRDASGEFIAFLDVDDFWPENNLPHMVQRMADSPTTEVVHGRAQVLKDKPEGGFEYLGSPADSFPHYIGAGLYRRSAFQRVGLFDKELRFGEDTDWFNRAAEVGLEVENLEEVTLFVRRHDENMTKGKNLVELNTLLLFKKALDRKRAGLDPAADEGTDGGAGADGTP